MKYALLSMLLLPLFCLGSEEKRFISGEALFNASDAVVILNVEKGEIFNNFYHMTGSIQKVYKGNFDKPSLSFKHQIGSFSDEPNRLGGVYLLFLSSDEAGYKSNNQGYSVIEIGKVASDREDLMLALDRLNLKEEMTKKGDSDFLLFPVRCSQSSKELCDLMLNNLGSAISRK